MNTFSITINKAREELQRRAFKDAGLKIPTYWKGFQLNGLTGPQNLLLGHLSIIQYAKYQNLPEIIIYEDDAYPCNECGKKLEAVIKNTPKDTQFLLLGWFKYRGDKENEFNVIDPRIQIYGSHAYLLRSSVYDRILSLVDMNTTSDGLYRLVNDGRYCLKEPLFIQYCSKYSMNKYRGYLYNDLCDKTPPPGFPDVETIYKNNPRDVIDEFFDRSKSYIYRPNGGNLGDFVISSCEHDYFSSIGLDYTTINKSNKPELFSRPFHLIYGGGGGWVNLYAGIKQIAEEYFQNRNLKSCIILPSTFHNVDNIVQMFDERFVVMCRDKRSYDYCTSINKRARFILHDDMAFGIVPGNYNSVSLQTSYTENMIKNKLKQYGNNFDTGFMLRTDSERTNVKLNELNFDLSSLNSRFGETLDKKMVDEGTTLFLATINKFNTIVTNRLHVGIIAAVLGKNVRLYDNSYGKVRAVFEYSMKDKYKNVTFVRDK